MRFFRVKVVRTLPHPGQGFTQGLLAFNVFSIGRDQFDPLGWIVCFLWVACAAIRLARFNVSPKDGKFFSGVPTTMAAAVLALSVLIKLPIPGLALLAGVAVLAFAMVSSFPYAKLARLFRLPPWFCGHSGQPMAFSSRARWRIIQAAERARQARAHSGAGSVASGVTPAWTASAALRNTE